MDILPLCSAIIILFAVVCAALACGLPLWAVTRSFPTTLIGDRDARLEVGIWKACLYPAWGGEKDCWSLRNDYVGEAFVAAQVLDIVGAALGMVSVLMLLVMGLMAVKDATSKVCAAICLLAAACYAAAFGCAVGGLHMDRGSSEEFIHIQSMKYGPSFYLGIAAIVLSVVGLPFAFRTAFKQTYVVG